MRRGLLFGCLLMLTAAAPAAELAAVLRPQAAHVGDTLGLVLTVQGAAGRTIRFPVPDYPDFVLLRMDSSADAGRKSMAYTLAVYDTGRFELPPLAVTVENAGGVDSLLTPPFAVTITSILPDTAQAILPLKPLREHPFLWRDVLAYWWIPLLAALAAAGYVMWRRLRRAPHVAESAAVIPALPPAEEAVRSLIALRDAKYPARGMLKEFFTEFSQIMRRYVERRCEFAALEMTTFELSREFADPRLPRIYEDTLLPVLQEADLVKFARYNPDYRRCDAILEQGFAIVDTTRPESGAAPQERAA